MAYFCRKGAQNNQKKKANYKTIALTTTQSLFHFFAQVQGGHAGQ